MKDELVKFETAKLAKEKGFNISQENSYSKMTGFICKISIWQDTFSEQISNDIIFAPTQSLLQRWLREVHKIFVEAPVASSQHDFTIGFNYTVWDSKNQIELDSYPNAPIGEHAFKTYEEALEQGLIEGLKLIK